MWVALAVSLVMTAISYALAPKPPKPKNAAAGRLDIPSPPHNEPIPVVFGTVWVKSPGVIYYGNPRQEKIKSKGGKK